MRSWYSIFPKSPWLSIYAWVVFCILPFFYILRSASPVDLTIGVTLLVFFFLSYYFSVKSKSGLMYMWISFEIVITVLMTLLFGYVYLSIFIAFFIGNIRNTVGFFIIYGLHIAILIGAIVAGFFIEIDLFLPQIHFIIISVIGVVLLPFNLYNRQKRDRLQDQLEVARQRISELTIVQERERIARDLHDTLGQKLSMIGLKSDLAVRLMERDTKAAATEIHDIRQISSTALKEVRVLVSGMRRVKLKDELVRVRQLLKAAEIELELEGDPNFPDMSPIVENVLVMCLKEAINNVVKHSYAKYCCIVFERTEKEFTISVKDNGIGIAQNGVNLPGNGLDGMEERLEFVNGSLSITSREGTQVMITVPAVLKQIKEG
ncbi:MULTISPECIES: sensor histidine kinase [Sporosarcina]|uniref:histidine kinase n=1 Tax=Sporosarcina newyorkensis TaxID=759851 RepID=A0A1T4YW37_9BACL|nr:MULTISPECIES: sensor histidine kinase [Sporosarcina]MBY0224147.1 sensor histidine kinase [Sporosarcina aquimarina]SKB05936.1 two-component system, NarL family, sensor histidine kinase DesK [Sporosarcina newyorkensis]